MKAAVIREAGGPEVLKIEHVPVPKPEPGQVPPQTTRSSVCTLTCGALKNQAPWVGGNSLGCGSLQP